jgi:hypothetical protein
MIKLPDIEIPKLSFKNLYFPYKLILDNIQREFSATRHRDYLGHVGNTAQCILELKLNYHEIHIVDSFTTYSSDDAVEEPYDTQSPRWIYYYIVESNPEIKKKVLARLFPLNPIAVNKEKTTMDEYFIKSDYDAGYSNTNVHLFFLKEDTFEEFPEMITNIIKDDTYDDGDGIHLKPSEMPYICHFGDGAKYITAGPKDKDCIVAIDEAASFIAQNRFTVEEADKIYHGGSLLLLEMSHIYTFSKLDKHLTGKDIIIGAGSSVFFSDVEDGVIIGRRVFVGENAYLGKKSTIHEEIKIDTFQSVGPYQEVKTPYPTILGNYDKSSASSDITWWLSSINTSIEYYRRNPK